MKDYTEKYKREMAFFIHPKTCFVTYNKKCLRCIHDDCKQSYRVQVVFCPTYEKKEIIIPEPKPTKKKRGGRAKK